MSDTSKPRIRVPAGSSAEGTKKSFMTRDAFSNLTASLGYGTNMISNWYSDVPEGRALLGLAPDERVIAFVHIGTFAGSAPERPRPDPAKLYADYAGPWKPTAG